MTLTPFLIPRSPAGMRPDAGVYLQFSFIFISYNFACFSLGQFVSSLSRNPLIAMTLRE